MRILGFLFQYLFIDIFGSVLYFPIWWYTKGFFGMLAFARERLQYRWRAYSFALWLKHFFVPMYGQYDFAGRVVSVFMRLAVLLGRSIAFIFEVFAYGALMTLWLGLPLITFVFFFVNIFQGFLKLF